MSKLLTKPDAIQFRGGVDTVRQPVLVQSGKFSVLQNFRQRHPGLEKRKGQIKHHSTADASLETMTLAQLSKGRISERRFFRQLVDGSVQLATDNPPTTTTGVFGSDVLDAVSNAIPASWGIIKDMVVFSDGVRQHQIYVGDLGKVRAVVAHSNGTLLQVPQIGRELTFELNDLLASTVATITSADRYLFVASMVPINSLTFTVSAANTAGTGLAVKYWKGAWTAVSGMSDGTIAGGVTFAQSGAVTWTTPTDELPHFMFGVSAYWYMIDMNSFYASMTSTSFSALTCTKGFQSLTNVWDGVLTDAIEAQVYSAAKTVYSIFGGASVTLNRLGTSDYVYIASPDPIAGFFLDPGATPNIVKATVTGSSNITFHDGGTGDDYISTTDGNFLSAGFEPGQSITITGSVSNNITTKIKSVTSNIIYVATGLLTAEANKSATITFGPVSCSINEVAAWTGTAFTAVTGLADETSGITKEGFVSWNRTSVVPERTQFNGSPFYAFWYRFKVSAALSANVNVGIEMMPYFDISEFGLGVSNAIWKERACYTFDQYPQYVYISASENPTALNGNDYGLLMAGDGRYNRVLCMRKFYNELLVWQEERGSEGGCTTLFEGYSPTTFGKLLLSNKVGIMNAKCAAVVDGVLTATKTEEKLKTLAFWLSRYGVMVTDGRTISVISDDIQNYFDPTKAECVRKGYESKHWLAYDSAENVLRLGLVSGSSATVPNIFPVYSITDGTWSFDTLGQTLSCMTEVEAASGNIPILQVGGGASDGFVYQLNQTQDDVSTAIDAQVTIEIDAKGRKVQLQNEALRVKTQSAGNITQTIKKNGGTATEDSRTLSMTAETAGDSYRRHKTNMSVTGHHFSINLRNNGAGESVYLEDIGFEISEVENNS